MLYLAQVQKNVDSDQFQLHLLAHEIKEKLWELDHASTVLIETLNEEQQKVLKEGLLVLIELDDQQKIINFKSSKNWLIEVIKSYLTGPMLDEEFLKQEQEQVEQWRREMALQSQDLTRRSLELELKQEQLQELEEKLKQQQKELGELKNQEDH